MSQAMLNMWISFGAMFLMFVSVVTAIFSREKLNGILQMVVLSFSFVCLVISGLIVVIIVLGGPTATAG
ncbi:DUF2768 domain-containing protein [Desertibacillus haloalkaliphilus]|uniref:DUF2768 domain-containing protein n=1 Tax=Desertibacillus haloalkaliphilus TaxID=1328930 RepID=UPI001C259E30|nr:DUF2768 domain-containing protein [Desertibacillus haloalkaliphilus]MBU8907232.1 DUF2768 domain-containing protein [Desertibacillus haloalkaliphilus]